MRPYAEHPVRMALQILADVLTVLWVVVVVNVALATKALVNGLQGPAMTLADAGDAVRGAFTDAANAARGLPFVGEDLARSLGTGTSAGQSLGDAGREQVAAVATAATGTAVAIVVIGAAPVVALWLALRVRWIVAARAARTARSVGPDLLALRALTRAPVRRLLAVSPDPIAAWRRDDRATIDGLAALELAGLGLRPPPRPAPPAGPAPVEGPVPPDARP
ncbi:hypothetical protein GCM10017691_56350 [Pseudonocardia petroleophila]|uniref:Transmembrane protein n=1 Tax=Pseudonocardia petroleophila TaxID=37331 RepID=A0A7G7MNE5_9PSEU|nr:hypothetical protein [Pseudonocardia petroleophila]QNG54306.1 hypothetical protein H6H00_10660 [Pseudonocardia petroleophila]